MVILGYHFSWHLAQQCKILWGTHLPTLRVACEA